MFLSYINYVSETNLLSLVFLFWLLLAPPGPSCSPPFPPVPFLAPVPLPFPPVPLRSLPFPPFPPVPSFPSRFPRSPPSLPFPPAPPFPPVPPVPLPFSRSPRSLPFPPVSFRSLPFPCVPLPFPRSPRSLPYPRSPRFSGGLILPVLLVPSRLSPSPSAFYPPLLP